MAHTRTPKPVKLIVGLLSADEAALAEARTMLIERFGPVDTEGEVIPFTFTNYYRDEMGENLLRQFLAFENLIAPDALAGIKIDTNAMEETLARTHQHADRPVNIDPGYLHLAKLVLASAKNFAHRVYLRDGIYAEVTLLYKYETWESLPWTFPDYRSGRYDDFFYAARARLKEEWDNPPA